MKDLEEAQAMVLHSRSFPGNFLPKCICSSVKALDNTNTMTGRVTLVVGTPEGALTWTTILAITDAKSVDLVLPLAVIQTPTFLKEIFTEITLLFIRALM